MLQKKIQKTYTINDCGSGWSFIKIWTHLLNFAISSCLGWCLSVLLHRGFLHFLLVPEPWATLGRRWVLLHTCVGWRSLAVMSGRGSNTIGVADIDSGVFSTGGYIVNSDCVGGLVTTSWLKLSSLSKSCEVWRNTKLQATTYYIYLIQLHKLNTVLTRKRRKTEKKHDTVPWSQTVVDKFLHSQRELQCYKLFRQWQVEQTCRLASPQRNHDRH